MLQKPTNFLDRLYNPIFQSTLILTLVVVVMFILYILNGYNIIQVDSRIYWVVAGTGVLFYALFNSVISLAVDDMNKYWGMATASYAVLMLTLGGLANLFSRMSINEAGAFRWIFMVLTFGYLLFLSIMRFMRKIVQIAQKEDDKWMERIKKE